ARSEPSKGIRHGIGPSLLIEMGINVAPGVWDAATRSEAGGPTCSTPIGKGSVLRRHGFERLTIVLRTRDPLTPPSPNVRGRRFVPFSPPGRRCPEGG